MTGGHLVGRPRKRPARLAWKAAESGSANRRGAPEIGSQKRRVARPRGAEPAASVNWSKPRWQNSNARQTISLGRVTALSMIGYNTRGCLAKASLSSRRIPLVNAPSDRRNAGPAPRRSKAIPSGQRYCSRGRRPVLLRPRRSFGSNPAVDSPLSNVRNRRSPTARSCRHERRGLPHSLERVMRNALWPVHWGDTCSRQVRPVTSAALLM